MNTQVITERWKVWGITFLYAVIVTILSSFHTVWRDEVITFSIVRESHSLAELFNFLKYCGHPGLWYFLLYVGYHVFPHPVILKIVNLLICIGAVYFFLNKAPFSWGQKILFIAGFFPLYLYPVFSRNYSISMLLIFLVAACYKDRWSRPIRLGMALFLLANAHAHSFITAGAVGAALLAELFLFKIYQTLSKQKRVDVLIGLAIWLLGLVLFIVQVKPPSDFIITSNGPHWVPMDILKAMGRAVLIPGQYFSGIFGYDSKILVNIIIFSLYVYLWRKKVLLIIFAAGVIALSMFFQLIFPSVDMRHEGSLYLLIIMVLWMDAFIKPEEGTARGFLSAWANYIVLYKNVLFSFLLLLGVCMSFSAIKAEILQPYSSAQRLAQLIKTTPALKDAILLSVPDSLMETMPYYLDNQIYFFSEGRFGKYRLLKTTNHPNFTLTDVLNAAENLKVQHSKPVVIVLSYQIADHGPYAFDFNYEEMFRYSLPELREFYSRTTFLANLLEAVGDERYRVFLLK